MTSKRPGDRPSKFQVICAWCGRVESRGTEQDAPVHPALPVSHTICAACFAKERAEIERVVRIRRRKSAS